MNLQQLFEHARDRAADLFNTTGEILPMWHAVTSDNEHLIIMTPWSGPEEKADTVTALRAMFAEKHVKQLAFICEAWVLALPSNTDITGELPAPSEHPDRREVLRISAEDSNGTQISGQYFILRPEHSKPKLSKFKSDEGMNFGGQMADMLAHDKSLH